jgi:thiosulfate/3-mercaptopyruvate sulfurtransferase
MISRTVSRIVVLGAIFFLAATFFLLPVRQAQISAEPWAKAQTVAPADLVRELQDPKTSSTVVFVGFQRLYTAGHIRGSQYHGCGGNADGLNQLRTWAASLPKTTNLVIYCGCCPIERCPNLRPAFTTLREMGFTKLRVLLLPTSFEVDWAEKSYPFAKGQ